MTCKIFKYNELLIREKHLISIILGYASFVLPMVVVGIFFDNSLHHVVYAHFTIGIILILVNLIRNFFALNTSSFQRIKQISLKNNLLNIAILIILIDYFFILMIYKERGWDALHFYFPNAVYFYNVDDIPSGINPYSLYPIFKPPLNVLYITYSFYVTKGIPGQAFANLHAFVFLIFTALLIHRITMELTSTLIISQTAVLFFLLTPLTYFMIYEYAYYQDLPLMFFYSSAIYFYWKGKDHYSMQYIGGISTCLAILSKLSGYTVIIVILILFSFSPRYNFFRYIVIFLLTTFLVYNTIFDRFIGTAAILIILALLLIRNIRNEPIQSERNFIHFILSMWLPILFGTFWLFYISQNEVMFEFIKQLYIQRENNEIAWYYVATTDPNLVFMENGMSVTFTASILYYFTGSMMGLTWAVFKFLELIKSRSSTEFAFLKSWIFSFLIIWYAYFGNVTSRYLTAILVPTSIITAIGLRNLYLRYFHSLNNSHFGLVSFIIIFSATLSYYPFIPLEYMLISSINYRLFLYHTNQLMLLTYLCGFMILFFVLSKYINRIDFRSNKTKVNVSVGLLALFLIAPQIGFMHNSGYDIDKFNEDANFFTRENFQEVINIIRSASGISDTIVSVNTPGLEYYLVKTVLDLVLIYDSPLRSVLLTNNLTKLLQDINDFEMNIFVLLEASHVYYEVYVNGIAHIPLIQLILNNTHFENILLNDEFSVYKRIN
ncbi:MAG: glycosyltransferase family 39 protein [Candidatus Heimdallarchaeota archaeon]|nr:glycosyltransferase family 39 protein [Candidatus Heimdallarchaeota archaeon]